MNDVVPTALAVLAVGLVAVALIALAGGNLTAAGMSFLSASLVIYMRETRTGDGQPAEE